jgi:hypothetical protein
MGRGHFRGHISSFKKWFLQHQVVDVESAREASVIVAEKQTGLKNVQITTTFFKKLQNSSMQNS